MTYQRFEDLPVWIEAIRLAEKVYMLTEDTAFQKQPSLRDQIERAAVSVSNNVAEGFGWRGSFHAVPCRTAQRFCASQISNLRFETGGGIMLAPVAWMGSEPAGIPHRRAPAFDRSLPQSFRTTKTSQGIYPEAQT